MRSVLAISRWVLLGILIFAAVFYLNFRRNMNQADPEYSGITTTEGLRDSVVIRFDQYAIPYISAKNDEDLYFTAGYITAAERMWHMEFNRLAAQGRLSEFVGSKAYEYDKFVRTIGFHRLGMELKDFIDSTSLAILKDYVRGINVYIETHQESLPVEYELLDFAPEPWTLEQSLAMIRLVAWEMTVAWHLDVVLGVIYNEMGEQKGQDIFPTYPDFKPHIISNDSRVLSTLLLPFLSIDNEFRKFIGSPGTNIGSNGWTISGKRSESGKPLLANDPHLGYGQPSRWYEMHLQSPGINAAGVTIPGLPGIVIGHNESIAWGLTSMMADDADFFVETVDVDNPYLYMYEGQWTGMERRKEVVNIKGQPADSFVVRITHHGPIISDVHPLGKDLDQVISMQWTGLEMSDELTAITRLNRATNWQEFQRAVNMFQVPAQNIIYADTAGNIGLRPVAKIPVRRNGRGNLPVPGDVDTYEWVRFIGPQRFPSLYNPPEGYIATANNKLIDSDRVGIHISNLYEPPSRIERIIELLDTKPKHTLTDFTRYQNDTISPHARQVTPFILNAFRNTHMEDDYLRAALTWLRTWDYSMDEESIPATIFNVTFMNLIRNIYLDELGEILLDHYVRLPNAAIRNTSWLLQRPVNPWWDDVTTNGFENRDVMLRRSLLYAIDWLKSTFGTSMVNWQWGRLHKVQFEHTIGRSIGVADLLYNFNLGPYERAGNGMTINNGAYSFQTPYDNISGPTMRHIVDLGDIDNTRSVIYSGQSGHPLNPHYNDQVELWLNGRYHRLPITESGVQKVTENTLYLVPSRETGSRLDQSD